MVAILSLFARCSYSFPLNIVLVFAVTPKRLSFFERFAACINVTRRCVHVVSLGFLTSREAAHALNRPTHACRLDTASGQFRLL